MQHTSQLPLIQVHYEVSTAWIDDDLVNTATPLARTLVSITISEHHILANRALARAHLQKWDAALDDAEIVSFPLQFSVPRFTRLYPSPSCRQ